MIIWSFIKCGLYRCYNYSSKLGLKLNHVSKGVFMLIWKAAGGNVNLDGIDVYWCACTRSFGVFFDLRLNKQLSKQSWGWWLETPLRSLWRHCNAQLIYQVKPFLIMRAHQTHTMKIVLINALEKKSRSIEYNTSINMTKHKNMRSVCTHDVYLTQWMITMIVGVRLGIQSCVKFWPRRWH